MVYLLAEKAFAQYPWCQRILRGIYEEGRKKRIAIREVEAPEEAAEENACILLTGASREWNNRMILRSRAAGLHPIILANQLRNPTGQPASLVTMDIHSSMELAVNYLYSLNKQRLALFGVNPRASSDPWRAIRFEELTGSAENIFYQDTTIEECFQRFLPRAADYDGVICVNDYAAVSLIRRLEQLGIRVPRDLYIVGYGDMNLSRMNKPSITSISDDYESFGKAALSICSMMGRNSSVASVKVNIQSRLHIRQSTDLRPFAIEDPSVQQEEPDRNLFYSDPEMSRLARVETLLSQCDETDFSLIRLLLEDASYGAMAEKCFISETAAKYRLKKMKTLCGVSSRKELAQCLRYFF